MLQDLDPYLPSNASDSPKPSPEQTLYPGSDLSVHDALVSVLSFAQTAHLTGTSLCNLLDLLHVLMPKPNNLPKTSHSFRKHFESNESELQLYYYCDGCWQKKASYQDKCHDCVKSKIRYFISCPIEPQLQKLYSRPGFADKLQYRHTRVKLCENNLEDIYDSSLYKEAERNVLNEDLNIS